MELVAKLSYIEEVQDSVKKRYNALKAEIRENGNLTDVKKQRSVSYATDMLEHANKHYYEVKHEVDKSLKTNRVATQIYRTMRSIKSYRRKIYDLCGYEYS